MEMHTNGSAPAAGMDEDSADGAGLPEVIRILSQPEIDQWLLHTLATGSRGMLTHPEGIADAGRKNDIHSRIKKHLKGGFAS